MGEVLLGTGWGHESHMATAKEFNVNYGEMQSRHKLVMAPAEEGLASTRLTIG